MYRVISDKLSQIVYKHKQQWLDYRISMNQRWLFFKYMKNLVQKM